MLNFSNMFYSYLATVKFFWWTDFSFFHFFQEAWKTKTWKFKHLSVLKKSYDTTFKTLE